MLVQWSQGGLISTWPPHTCMHTSTVWEVGISKKGLALAPQQVEHRSPSFSNSLRSHWGFLLGRRVSTAFWQDLPQCLGFQSMALDFSHGFGFSHSDCIV